MLALSICMDVMCSGTKVHCKYQGLAKRDEDNGGQRKPRKTPSDALRLGHVYIETSTTFQTASVIVLQHCRNHESYQNCCDRTTRGADGRRVRPITGCYLSESKRVGEAMSVSLSHAALVSGIIQEDQAAASLSVTPSTNDLLVHARYGSLFFLSQRIRQT